MVHQFVQNLHHLSLTRTPMTCYNIDSMWFGLFFCFYWTIPSPVHLFTQKKSSFIPNYTSTIPFKTLMVTKNKTWLHAPYLEHTFLLSLFWLPQHFWWPWLIAFPTSESADYQLQQRLSSTPFQQLPNAYQNTHSSEQAGSVSHTGTLQWNLFCCPTFSSLTIASFLLGTNEKGEKSLTQRLARSKVIGINPNKFPSLYKISRCYFCCFMEWSP